MKRTGSKKAAPKKTAPKKTLCREGRSADTGSMGRDRWI